MHTTISRELSIVLESFEEMAWLDMYQGAPTSFVQAMGLSYEMLADSVAFFCTKIPFIHFNTILTLGLKSPANEDKIEAVIQAFRAKGINSFYLHYSPFSEPADLPNLLTSRGFAAVSSWDRIYREGQGLPKPLAVSRNLQVKEITSEDAERWADFIDATYGMVNKPWLMNLVGRLGWRHFIVEENDVVSAARSVYMKNGFAWLGIDAPIPGLMTKDYERDYLLLYHIVKAGLQHGVQHFLADIELPDDAMNLPSYHNIQQLGFRVVYRRQNYKLS